MTTWTSAGRGLVALALAGSLVACGSDDGGAGGSDGSGPVTIGGMTFKTGDLANYGALAVCGMEAAVDYVNANGGVLDGRDLELDLADTQSDQAQAISLANKFASDQDVVGIVGPSGTPDLLALMPVAKRVDLPIVSFASAQILPKEDFPPNLFRVSLVQAQPVLTDFLRQAAEKSDIESIGIVYEATNPQPTEEGKNVAAAAEDLGITVTGTETYNGTDTSYTTQVSKLVNGKPDAIWIAGVAPHNAQIIQQARARGFDGQILGGAAIQDPTVAEIAGADAVGLMTFVAFDLASDRPLVTAFNDAVKKQCPDQASGGYTVYAFDAVLLLAEAINQAGSTDRQQVTEALGSLSEAETVEGTYTFDGSGDNTAPVPYFAQMQEDGSFKTVQ